MLFLYGMYSIYVLYSTAWSADDVPDIALHIVYQANKIKR